MITSNGMFFKDRPAKYVIEGDIVQLADGGEWRVMGITYDISATRCAFTVRSCTTGIVKSVIFPHAHYLSAARGY